MPCEHPFVLMLNYDDSFKVVDTGKPVITRKVFDRYTPDSFKYWCTVYDKVYLLPCGKCQHCLMKHAREFGIRCCHEFQMSNEVGCFLTLTYNDEHLHYENGFPSLYRPDLQAFMKMLRRAIEPTRVSFLACGEYGENTLRPHFHVLLFGWVPSDLEPIGRTGKGNVIYTSDFLLDRWKAFGFISLGTVTPDSIDYTCRYSLKKTTQPLPADVYKPFVASSRNPALGLSWLRKFWKSCLTLDENGDIVSANTLYRGHLVSLPRYYLRKLPEVTDGLVTEAMVKDYVLRSYDDDDLITLDALDALEMYSSARAKRYKQQST